MKTIEESIQMVKNFDFKNSTQKEIEDAILINPFNNKVPNEFSVTTFNIGYCS